jgi:two-component system, OmpR family, sensor kinase
VRPVHSAFAATRRFFGRLRRLPARTPLRVKLVAALMLLVIVALAGSGLVAAATLRHYLVGRVDTQLKSVNAASASAKIAQIVASGRQDQHGRGHDPSSDELRLPSAFVVAATSATGSLLYGPTSDLVNPHQPLPRLPQPTGAASKAAGTRALTVSAVQGDGSWRVVSRPVTLADGSQGTLLVAQSLDDVDNTVNQLILLVAIIGAAGAVVLAGVGYMLVRASLRPLRDVERTAAKIAAGDLSSRVPDADSRTEVGQLSQALNTMLSRVETAFAERAASETAARTSEERMRVSEAAARQSEERMRRFVADASHELRTPLTSIRGFAELFRQGAAQDGPDVARMMRRIEDEAERMGLLVEDLLLLARLDQERPLARKPVDMLAVAQDIVHDAKAVDGARPITLKIGSTEFPPVVVGDEPRLRQVMANLVFNALKHTPPGTPIQVTLATRDTPSGWQVSLEVADHGPGLREEHAARVFERFYRGDAARTRDTGSTGLGLAIVAALVAGHGGAVTLDTAPGRGARFQITLPLAMIPA